VVVHTTAAADPEGVLAERLASEMANYAWQARKTPCRPRSWANCSLL
jgi:hypothetical protein